MFFCIRVLFNCAETTAVTFAAGRFEMNFFALIFYLDGYLL